MAQWRRCSIAVALIAMAVLSTGCIGGPPTSWVDVVRNEINTMLDAFAAAMKAENADYAVSFYCDPFIVAAGSTEVSYTRDQQKVILQTAFTLVDYLAYDITNRRISPVDNTNAVAVCDFHLKAASQSLGIMEEIDRVELTLRKEAGQWRMARYSILQVTPLGTRVIPQGTGAPIQ